jgi:hypothetical protein
MRLLYLLSLVMGPKTFARFLVFWVAVVAFVFYCLIQR